MHVLIVCIPHVGRACVCVGARTHVCECASMRSMQTQFELTNKSAAIARNRDDKPRCAINVLYTESSSVCAGGGGERLIRMVRSRDLRECAPPPSCSTRARPPSTSCRRTSERWAP